jgi:heavy metal sensor kinase
MNVRSIRFQLTAWYAVLLNVVFVLLGGLMVLSLEHHLKANLGDSQVVRARQLADTLLVRIGQTGEEYVINQIKAVYAPEIIGRFIRITRDQGRVLYVSGQPKDQSFDPIEVPPLVRASQARAFWYEQSLPGNRNLIIGSMKFQAPDGKMFLVEVGAPTAPIRVTIDRFKLQLLVGLPIVIGLAVGGGYLLVGRALAPVDQIAAKAAQITQHNLSERLPVARTADELERLSMALNHMIRRLEEALLNSKRFIADASHELRTPLTVLRGEMEALVRNSGLAPELRESLGSLLEEVERLGSIVEGLLAISRLDAGEAQANWVQFDLAKLVATTADQMSLLAEDKGISVSCEASQPVLVQGDPARLKQVVVNLFDNAVKYTPEKGKIQLRVAMVNDRALLELADTGIGIAPEALPRIFDRFFRVDTARSRDQGGAGLGLAIVKSICTAHQGQVEVSSQPGQGSSFRVLLPLISSKDHKFNPQPKHEPPNPLPG